jgi:hypothetical protein
MKLKIKGKTVLYKNVARKIAKPLGYATKAAGIGLALGTVGLPAVATALAAEGAMKLADKYAGKKLGKYKAYRVARGLGSLGTDIYKGNVIGGLGDTASLYQELDPNKKRVKKFEKVNTNYISPTLQLAGAAKSVSKVNTMREKYNANQRRYEGYQQLK